MSIASVLAFVVGAIAAKSKSMQVARPSEDHPELAELEAKVAELEDALATSNSVRDVLAIDRDDWRARAEAYRARLDRPGFGAQMPAGPDFRPVSLVEQQSRQALQQAAVNQMQNQMAAAQAYQGQAANMPYGQGLAGLLGGQAFEDFCNCVPARHDLFLPR